MLNENLNRNLLKVFKEYSKLLTNFLSLLIFIIISNIKYNIYILLKNLIIKKII